MREEGERDGVRRRGKESGREGTGWGGGHREKEGMGREGRGGKGKESESYLSTTHTQEEYDIVTNDYEKAKSLFAGTQVKVFKKGIVQLLVWHLCLFMYITITSHLIPTLTPPHHHSLTL